MIQIADIHTVFSVGKITLKNNLRYSTVQLFVIRLLLLILLPLAARAQFTYTLDQSVPVEVNGAALLNPWAGGLNSAQVNSIDLNGDGQQDLVVYDKMASKVSTFLAVNKTYVYAPKYESLFPPEINTFLILRDYNCDGKKDLFTFGQIGIYVFQNTTASGQPLSWKKITFYNPGGTTRSEVLLTTGFSGKINLLPGSNDFPNLKDMDGDGDLDVLNMRFVSPSTAEYHKNFSMERYGRCDSLDLERQTQNWGGFEECSCGKIAFGETCVQLGGRTEHTGGKALLSLDMDNDGDQDLVFSEETCSRLYYMQNTGTAALPVVNNFTLFPGSSPTGIIYYPAGYLEDVDFDGKTDLIASPNLYARVQPENNFQQSLWLYSNTGTNQLPNFTLVKNNFLQETMIDVGDQSAPTFADLDQDGDDDMIIGRYIDANRRGTLSYYENTGTARSPAFSWITDDFLGISFLNNINISPQFVDFDGNGAVDLMFSGTDILTGKTEIFYALSKSASKPSYGGQEVQTLNFSLGTNENFFATDVDLDGKVDLLVGRSNGALEYWRNGGTSLSLLNNKYLGLGPSFSRQNISMAAGDLDGDGQEDLILGDQSGKLSVYSDFRHTSAGTPVTGLVYDPFTNAYPERNLGGWMKPTVVNLFGTDKPAIVTGNTQGGLYILRNESGQVLADTPAVNMYPNPIAEGGTLSIKADRNMTLRVYTVLGQPLGTSFFVPANQIVTYPMQGVNPGVYIARFVAGSKTQSIRFVIR
ncbi:MAG: T9SS type A sorting domain-containing protein [Cyclobacteriaceae bacterium]|nr:T9SS type A sorting domain-containing protein [Cyclobacteriaceae bacterium]